MTCAAEFKAVTPYYYSTFEEEVMIHGNLFVDNESKSSGKKKIVVLGSGQIELVRDRIWLLLCSWCTRVWVWLWDNYDQL